jgi:AcrR family transcriptional regulator
MSDNGTAPGHAPRGKGRPPTIDRVAVLDAAILTFWEKGYEGASLSDLTEAMHLSRPSLYLAFGDKASLFDAGLTRYSQTFGARPLAAFEAEPDIARAVRAFLRVSLEGNTEAGLPAGCLIACCATTAATDDHVRQRCSDFIAATTHILIKRFASEVGLSTSPTPEERAVRMVDFMYAQAIRARAGETRAGLMDGLDGRVRAVLGSE